MKAAIPSCLSRVGMTWNKSTHPPSLLGTPAQANESQNKSSTLHTSGVVVYLSVAHPLDGHRWGDVNLAKSQMSVTAPNWDKMSTIRNNLVTSMPLFIASLAIRIAMGAWRTDWLVDSSQTNRFNLIFIIGGANSVHGNNNVDPWKKNNKFCISVHLRSGHSVKQEVSWQKVEISSNERMWQKMYIKSQMHWILNLSWQ